MSHWLKTSNVNCIGENWWQIGNRHLFNVLNDMFSYQHEFYNDNNSELNYLFKCTLVDSLYFIVGKIHVRNGRDVKKCILWEFNIYKKLLWMSRIYKYRFILNVVSYLVNFSYSRIYKIKMLKARRKFLKCHSFNHRRAPRVKSTLWCYTWKD